MFKHLSRHSHFQAFKPFLHIFEHFSLHTPPEAFMPLYNPGFLCAFHFDRLYIFLLLPLYIALLPVDHQKHQQQQHLMIVPPN